MAATTRMRWFRVAAALSLAAPAAAGDVEITAKGSSTGRKLTERFADFVNVKDFGAKGDGTRTLVNGEKDCDRAVGTNDTAAISAARAAAAATGKILFFPPGVYLMDGSSGALNWGDTKGMVIRGSGSETTTICVRTPGHGIEVSGGWTYTAELSDFGLIGFGPDNPTVGHGIYFHDNGPYGGPSNLHFRDLVISRFSGKGMYLPEEWHSRIENILIDDCGDNLFELQGGNTTTLFRCYAQHVRPGKAGFRIHGGAVTMIACNGINNDYTKGAHHLQADWGVFGRQVYSAWTPSTAYGRGAIRTNAGQEYEVVAAGTSTAQGGPRGIYTDIVDGTVRWRHIGAADSGVSYAKITLIGCNIEAVTRHGIRAKIGSDVRMFGATFIPPAGGAGPYIGLWTEYASSNITDRASMAGLWAYADRYDHGTGLHSSFSTPGSVLVLGGNVKDGLRVYSRDLGSYSPAAVVSGASTNGAIGAAVTANKLYVEGAFATRQVGPMRGGSIEIDPTLGNAFYAVASDGRNLSIGNPLGGGMPGQRITITIANKSGGALGTVTWGTAFRLAAFTPPSAGRLVSVDFMLGTSNSWIEVGRSSADVPAP